MQIALMGEVLNDDEVADYFFEIEGHTEPDFSDWAGQGLVERDAIRSRVVLRSIGNWKISPDALKKLKKWAESLTIEATNRDETD